jgi:hypothetical protein
MVKGIFDKETFPGTILNPKTKKIIVRTEKRIPLKGLPEAQANTATDKRGKLSRVQKFLFDGCHFVISSAIRM